MLPGVESLAQTRLRVMSFWEEHTLPRSRHGECILVSAHKNTVRAMMMDPASMGIEDVKGFEIPTATPIVYCFDSKGQPIDWHYLNENAEIAKSA